MSIQRLKRQLALLVCGMTLAACASTAATSPTSPTSNAPVVQFSTPVPNVGIPTAPTTASSAAPDAPATLAPPTPATDPTRPSVAAPDAVVIPPPSTAPTDATRPTPATPDAPTTPPPAAPSAQGAAAVPQGNGELVQTAIMQELGITGQRWATLGDPNAPITMVEFSDFGCPFCNRYTSTVYPIIKKEYIDTGKVFYVFKDFPLIQLHPQAALASEAAECVGEQGKYWEMHRLLFINQSTWGSSAEEAEAAFGFYAGALGVDEAVFAACYSEHRYATEVQTDLSEGKRLGITGTPTFVINGKQLIGAQPLNAFVNAINNELAAQ